MNTYHVMAIGVYGLGSILTLAFLAWIDIVYNWKDNTPRDNFGAATVIVAFSLVWPLFWLIAAVTLFIRGRLGRG